MNSTQIRSYFNDAAGDEQHFPSTIDPRIQHVRVVLDHLREASTGRIADIGCGKGRFARIVRQQYPAASVIALDLAEAMLRSVPPALSRVAASMTALPLASASLDAVYATESLEHAVDIPQAVAELTRIVRPGGRIVIIDKNVEAWGRTVDPSFEIPHWERWFGARELEKLLSRDCRRVSSRPISYWADVPPDGSFLVWLAIK